MDIWLEEAKEAGFETEDRAGLYEQTIEALWEKAPRIFLYDAGQLNAAREEVRGLIHHPREIILFNHAYITE